MTRAVVIGGGVGGLTAAIRLRVAGHDVTVVERNHAVGGKLAVFERDGFIFDVGPSLVTLPHVFDEVFRLAGTSLDEQVTMVRLDPQFRYSWRDGSALAVPDDPDATAAAFEAFAPGAGDQWREFDANGRTIWDVSERTFFAGPMSNPMSLLKRMESPRDLLDIDALRTLRRAARDTFDDDHLRQWAGRYATYSGSSPAQAPATLACIPHIESRFGCWYPMGGLGALRAAFEQVGDRRRRRDQDLDRGDVDHVHARTASPALRSTTGAHLDAPIVVANVDARHLYDDLLPDRAAAKRVRKARPSTSGFVLCIGVRGRTDGIGHHNVWFSDDALPGVPGDRRRPTRRRSDDLRLRVVDDRSDTGTGG